jgi:hypothetical protein
MQEPLQTCSQGTEQKMNCMLQHNYLAMYPTYQRDQELVYAFEAAISSYLRASHQN